MKIGCISKWGDAWSVLFKAEQAGHRALLYVEEKSDAGDGFVKRAGSAEAVLKFADITFVDGCGFGRQAEKWRAEGYKIVNGSEWADKLEEDRAYGMQIAKEVGMAVPACKEYATIPEAIHHIESKPGCYACKMSGTESSSTSVVAKEDDSSDVLAALEGFLKNPKPVKGLTAVALQERVQGVEIGCCAWADGHGWVQPYNVHFEHKPLCNDGVGPLTGEMGTVMFNSEKLEARIWKETLALFEPLVKDDKYIGEIAVNTIYDGKKFWFLEMTMRQGYPSTYIEGELINGTYPDLFAALVNRRPLPWRTAEWSCGVNVGAIGYPFEESYKVHGKDMLVKSDWGSGIWPLDVVLKPDESVMTAGVIGLIACCVGTDKALTQAIAKAYKAVKRIILPHKVYRTDIGARVVKEFEKIRDTL